MKQPTSRYAQQVADARRQLLQLARAELARRKTDLTDPVADAEAAERVLDEIEQMAERRRAFDICGHRIPPAMIDGVPVEDDRSSAEKIADALIEGGWEAAARALAAYLESQPP
jgi:hypothetical protein